MKDKLKEGDKVVMHTCAESDLPKYKNKLLTCTSESFIRNGNHVVFLKEVSGYFLVDFLQKVDTTYTKQDIDNAYYKGYDKGYEDGYDKAWMWDV